MTISRFLAAAALSAVPTVAQIDRETTEPVAYSHFHALTSTELATELADPHNFRIANLEIESTSPAVRYSGTIVQRTGVYARDWMILLDKTRVEIEQFAQQNHYRVYDIERYIVGRDTERFAALLFDNSRTIFQQSNWYGAVPEASVPGLLAITNTRPIDMEVYEVGGQRFYELITVQNTGTNYEPFTMLMHTSVLAVSTHLDQTPDRIYDLEITGPAQCSCILLHDGIASTTRFQETFSSVYLEDVVLGGRIVDIDEFNGFHVITMLDNYDPFEQLPGAACAGSSGLAPEHWAEGTGISGSVLTFRGMEFPAMAPAVMHLGFTDVAAPLDLVGAPGCALSTLPAVAVPLVTDGLGFAEKNLLINQNPALHGALVRTQMLAIDPPANALGIITSGGLRTTLRHW